MKDYALMYLKAAIKLVKYTEAAVKLHMAVCLALKRGNFPKEIRDFIERMKDEAEKLIGTLEEETIQFLERYYD